MKGKKFISLILAGVGFLTLLEYNNEEKTYPEEYDYLFDHDVVNITYDNYNIKNASNEIMFEGFSMSYEYMSDKNLVQYVSSNGALSYKARCLFNFKGFYSYPLLAEYLLLSFFDETETSINNNLDNLLNDFLLYVNEGYVKININYGKIKNDRLFELVNYYYELIISDENTFNYINEIINLSTVESYSDLYNDLLSYYTDDSINELNNDDEYELTSIFNQGEITNLEYIRYIINSDDEYLVSSSYSFENIVTNPLLAQVIFLCNLSGNNNYLSSFISYCKKGYLVFDNVNFTNEEVETAITNTMLYMENKYNSDYYLEDYIESYQRVHKLPSDILFE